MKSYKEIVEKQFKIHKRKNFFNILGIMLITICLTAIIILFKYSEIKDIEFIKTHFGNYEVSYSVSKEKVDKTLDILKNSTLVKEFTIEFDRTDISKNLGEEEGLYLSKLSKEAIEKTFQKKFQFNLLEGKIPTKKGELLVGNRIGKKIGEKLTIENEEYAIVGIIESYEGAFTLGDFNKNEDITVYVNLNSSKKTIIQDINQLSSKLGYEIERLDSLNNNDANIMANYNLIDLVYKVNSMKNQYTSRKNILLILIVLISIVIIYGSISFSLKEKMKEFAVLRCLGASSKQIKTLIYREIFMLMKIAVFPAIIIGYLIDFLFLEYIYSLNLIDDLGISLGIYPKELLQILLIILGTIFLATFMPARSISKCSPLEGIKKSKTGQVKVKRRKSKFIRKIFSVEGELAYKSLRANPISFYLTTIIMSLSFIIIIIANSLITTVIEFGERESFHGKGLSLNLSNNPKIDNGNAFDNKKYYNEKLFYEGLEEKEKIFKILKDNGIEEGIAAIFQLDNNLVFIENTKGLNKEMRTFRDYYNIEDKEFIDELGKKVVFEDSGIIYVYNDEAFNMIKDKVGDGSVTLEEFKDNGLIAVECYGEERPFKAKSVAIIDEEKGTKIDVTIANRNYISNDERGPISELKEMGNKYSMNFLGAIKGVDTIGDSKYNYYRNSFIISENFLKKNLKEIVGTYENGSTNNYSIFLNFKDDEEKNRVYPILENEIKNNFNGYINNHEEQLKESKKVITLMKNIFYLGMTIIIVILIMSIIFNKINTLESRKKEFGLLLSLGLERKGVNKILLLEAILQWIIILIIGIPISIEVNKIVMSILILESTVGEIKLNISFMLLVAILFLIINLFFNIIPFRRLQKESLVEMIKTEE